MSLEGYMFRQKIHIYQHLIDVVVKWVSKYDFVRVMFYSWLSTDVGVIEAPFVDSLMPSDAYTRQWNKSTLVQIMACRLVGAKSLSKPMPEYG